MAKKKSINGYQLVKFLYGKLDSNPEMAARCKPAHVALFLWIIELQNRLGWDKHNFGLPLDNAMYYSCIGNTKTYGRTINDLVEWGLIKEISPSKNQYTARRISLRTDELKAFLKDERSGVVEESAGEEKTEAKNNQVPEQTPNTIINTAEDDDEALPF